MKVEPMIMSVSGQDWNVAVLGPENAERTLLLCNGIGASLETILPFAKHFKRTRLVAFDVPGTGGSPTPNIPYRLRGLAQMLNKILDRLEIGKVDVFGVSWGGGLAQQFVYDFQPRCQSMILAATAAGYVMVPAKISILSKMITPKRLQDPEYLESIAAELYGGELSANSDFLKDHSKAMRAGDKRGYLYQLLAVCGWTSFRWLPKIKVPTLILMGDDDPLVPSINGRILASRLPDATLEYVQCGHLFMLTQAEFVAERIETFLHDQRRDAA